MRRPTPYQAAIACKGCRRPLGVWRVPAAHARASRADVAAELIRREREAAVCDRCRGVDRDARKAARRAAMAAEAADAAARRALPGLTQDERALTVACPLARCGAAVGEECLWIAGALTLGSGATHARRLEAASLTPARRPGAARLASWRLHGSHPAAAPSSTWRQLELFA